MSRNIFDVPDPLPDNEVFTELLGSADVRIERIVSTGQATPPGQWYDQREDEWVVLIQGEAVLQYESGEKHRMSAGDHILLPARCRHRVVYTSTQPPCIWMAVFGNLQ
ncbi:MAG: cupin domain-containing protein [Chloroflexi bacterium]|nr:cupin domain-containing protein [Chloroflexota bacterium]